MLRAGGLQHTSRIKTKTDPHYTTTKMPFGRWWERIASDFRSVYVSFTENERMAATDSDDAKAKVDDDEDAKN